MIKNGFYIKKILAFTIAEILIVLAIIGIVAAYTIPSLINDSQKTVYVIGLKKAYSEINQVLSQITTDYNCTGDLRCTGIFGGNPHPGSIIASYMKIAKNCGTAQNQGCWSDSTGIFLNDPPSSAPTSGMAVWYNGSGMGASINMEGDSSAALYYKFVTIDGMSFAIWDNSTRGGYDEDDKNCAQDWSTHKSGHMTQTCGVVVVDVNGIKKPNILGRDTFIFWITNGKGPLLYPRGGMDDYGDGGPDFWWNNNASGSDFCSGKSGKTLGEYCTGRIIEKSWTMDY